MQAIIRSIRAVLHPIRSYKSIVQEINDSDQYARLMQDQTRQLLKKQFQGSNDPKDDYVFSMLVKMQELEENRRKTYVPVLGALINGFIIALSALFVYKMQSKDKKDIQNDRKDLEMFKWVKDLFAGVEHSKHSESMGFVHKYEQNYKDDAIPIFKAVQVPGSIPSNIKITTEMENAVEKVNSARICSNDYVKQIKIAKKIISPETGNDKETGKELPLSSTVLAFSTPQLNSRMEDQISLIDKYNKVF
eukprot:NODE_552_length_6806_cov_0.530938.p4 type:complete len:248 gc:universal NODE_552_length_6806_cov_0.530938:391-1134(+)